MKQVFGKDFAGVLSYALQPSKKPALIGGSAGGQEQSLSELVRRFDHTRYLRPECNRCVHHAALSFAPDEQVTNEKLQELAREYLRRMGWELTKTRWVLIQHGDTDHHHAHLIASRIQLDGRVVSDKHSFRRGQSICRELEEQFQLKRLSSLPPVVRPLTAKEEQILLEYKQLRLADSTPVPAVVPLVELQKILLEETRTRISASRLVARLESRGVGVLPRVTETGAVMGLAFRLQNRCFNAATLGERFKWKNLQQQGVDYDHQRDYAALIRAGGREIERSSGRIHRHWWTWPDAFRDAIARQLDTALAECSSDLTVADHGIDREPGYTNRPPIGLENRVRTAAADEQPDEQTDRADLAPAPGPGKPARSTPTGLRAETAESRSPARRADRTGHPEQRRPRPAHRAEELDGSQQGGLETLDAASGQYLQGTPGFERLADGHSKSVEQFQQVAGDGQRSDAAEHHGPGQDRRAEFRSAQASAVVFDLELGSDRHNGDRLGRVHQLVATQPGHGQLGEAELDDLWSVVAAVGDEADTGGAADPASVQHSPTKPDRSQVEPGENHSLHPTASAVGEPGIRGSEQRRVGEIDPQQWPSEKKEGRPEQSLLWSPPANDPPEHLEEQLSASGIRRWKVRISPTADNHTQQQSFELDNQELLSRMNTLRQMVLCNRVNVEIEPARPRHGLLVLDQLTFAQFNALKGQLPVAVVVQTGEKHLQVWLRHSRALDAIQRRELLEQWQERFGGTAGHPALSGLGGRLLAADTGAVVRVRTPRATSNREKGALHPTTPPEPIQETLLERQEKDPLQDELAIFLEQMMGEETELKRSRILQGLEMHWNETSGQLETVGGAWHPSEEENLAAVQGTAESLKARSWEQPSRSNDLQRS